MCASTFIRQSIDEKSFINLGDGENGKSVLLDYLSKMLGKENVSHIPLQVFQMISSLPLDLTSKLANIFSDLEKNELRHTGMYQRFIKWRAYLCSKQKPTRIVIYILFQL